MGNFLQFEVESGPAGRRTYEAEQVSGRADHRHPEGAGGGSGDGRRVPSTRDIERDLLQMEGQVCLYVSEARRLKALEDENARLKKLLAESMLNEAALRDLLGKKW